jgi:hypothetical protein
LEFLMRSRKGKRPNLICKMGFNHQIITERILGF